LAVLDGEVAVP